jgi:CheY-like chemotaxis protein
MCAESSISAECADQGTDWANRSKSIQTTPNRPQTFFGLLVIYVETASNGLTAITAVVSTGFDVVHRDIGLPESNEYDIATGLRRETTNLSPHLVAITGWSDEQVRAKAAESGIDLSWSPIGPRMLVNPRTGSEVMSPNRVLTGARPPETHAGSPKNLRLNVVLGSG